MFNFITNFKALQLSVLASFIGLSAFAQPIQRCHTTEHTAELIRQNPKVAKGMARAEEASKAYIQANSMQRHTESVITIPVVIHVLYRTTAQNVADAQLQSQIDVLNADYAGLNGDSTAIPTAFKSLFGKSKVRFCLAVRDPQGNPTTGIIRKSTTKTSFSDSDDGAKYNSLGGDDAWDASKYLNLWCCNLGTTLLGYAQFPGGLAATDGVVINYRYFGNSPASSAPFDKGRTASHEVGHWLGLYHIWGDSNCGNDQISDTPTQQTANSGCPTFPNVTCSNGPNGDMFMNYMDYVDDGCMQMFTRGQVVEMESVMATSRASLAASDGCLPVTLQAIDGAIQTISSLGITACATTVKPVFTFKNTGMTDITLANFEYTIDGGAPISYTTQTLVPSLGTLSVTMPESGVLATGLHTIVVNIVSINGAPDTEIATANTLSTTGTIVASPSVTNVVEDFSNGFAGTSFIISNPDNSVGWKDTTAANGTPRAAYMNNFDYTTGNGKFDDFSLPAINMSATSTPFALDFDVAYTYYSVEGTDCGTTGTGACSYDTLVVLVSANCGATFTEVYRKQKDLLKTVASQQTAFFPTPNTPAQWRREHIDLAPFAGNSEVVVKFRSISNYENNLYIDNINVQTYTATDAKDAKIAFMLQPNPAKDAVRLNYTANTSEPTTIEVFDMLGKRISTQTWQVQQGSNSFTLDTNAFPNGIYNVVLRSANQQGSQKLIINR